MATGRRSWSNVPSPHEGTHGQSCLTVSQTRRSSHEHRSAATSGHCSRRRSTTWVLATMLAIVQPRFLGPSAQGELRLAFSLWTIAQVIIGLGTALFLTLEIARDRVRGLASVGPVLVIADDCVRRGVGGARGLLVIATLTEDSWRSWRCSACRRSSFAMTDAFIAVFVGLERMSVLAKATIIAKVVGTVVAIVVLLAGGHALAVVIVLAAANLLGMLILVSLVPGRCERQTPRLAGQRSSNTRREFGVPPRRCRPHHLPTARHGDHVVPRRQRCLGLVQHG